MTFFKTSRTTVWGVAIFAIALLAVGAALAPIDGATGPDGIRFIGRFHPLALHLPIAFLLLVPLLEASRLFPRLAELNRFAAPVLLLAAVTAFLTVALGLMLAAGEGHAGDLVDRHRWGGVTVAALAAIAFVARVTLKEPARSRAGWTAYGGVLASAIAVLMVTAHAGGSLVHGPGYLAEYAPAPIARLLAEEPAAPVAAVEAHGDLPVSAATIARFESDIRPMFDRYCAKCHGDGKQEANFRVDALATGMTTVHEVHAWRRAMNKLNAHQMPPEDARPLPDDERTEIIAWIETALKEEALSRRANYATAQMRRLSKREFNHTLQDLFRVRASFAAKLPADPRSEKGYDTDASLLRVSEVDLRVYMDVARGAVDRYVTFDSTSDEVEQYFQEFEDNYHHGRWRAHHLSIDRAPRPLPAGEFARRVAAHGAGPPVYHEQFLGALPYGPVSYGDEEDQVEVRAYARRHEMFVYIQTRKTVGEMVVRVHAAATPAARDGAMPRMRLEVGETYGSNLLAMNVGEHDVTAPTDAPGVYEYRFRLEDARSPPNATLGGGPGDFDRPLLLVFSNVARHPDGVAGPSKYAQEDPLLPDGFRVNGKLPGSSDRAIEGDRIATAELLERRPGFLHLDALEVTITPVASEADVGWTIANPGAGAALADEQRIVRGTLGEFLPVAFRRHVTDDELERFLATFSGLREKGVPYERAVRETLASVLVSPEFLFIGNPAPESLYAGEADREEIELSIALASRLSFFIWSSAPDERLRTLASVGALVDPRTLAQETLRLLEDERSRRFSEAFARQWLRLDGMGNGTVSADHYPEFSPDLGRLMVRQTVATFQDAFHHGRDARSLFTDEHMFLNDRLARHYGLPPVAGGELRRVALDQDVGRAGLVAQASILAINSNGIDSNPVKRGVWLLERILDDPPPPPPPNVPSLGADGESLVGLTLREQIEAHRDKSACINCHEKIDPFGLALENFDASGAWRESIVADDGEGQNVLPVDASTVLPGGFEIDGAGELGAYLLEQRERDVMRGLVRHMMTYAIGHELDILDEQEAEAVAEMFRTSGYNLQHLVLAIVQSDSFAPQVQVKERANG
ncbi:MAG TPA: DUF1592 domain-containing protein [Woeseiaceae bacterium]|nr:DUF1592 domain-containing protein [Woeseiaceae bacterium]